jgi:hypothetical protein
MGKPRAAAGTVTEGAAEPYWRASKAEERRKFGASGPSAAHTSTCTAMDPGDPIHDAFSSDRLWQQPSFFDEDDVQGSSLFAPLQLDSEPSRLVRKHVNASSNQ